MPPEILTTSLVILFLFFAGHGLADFALQNEFIGIYKSPTKVHPVIKGKIWDFILAAHTLIHAGLVLIITGNILLGLIELAVHIWIDYAKCKEKFGFRTDQFLHYTCKVVYTALIATGTLHCPWLPFYKLFVLY